MGIFDSTALGRPDLREKRFAAVITESMIVYCEGSIVFFRSFDLFVMGGLSIIAPLLIN